MFVAMPDGDTTSPIVTNPSSQARPKAKVNPATAIHVSPGIDEVENNPDSAANAAALSNEAASTVSSMFNKEEW